MSSFGWQQLLTAAIIFIGTYELTRTLERWFERCQRILLKVRFANLQRKASEREKTTVLLINHLFSTNDRV